MPSVPLPEGIERVAIPPDPPTVPGVLQRLKAIQRTFREEPLADAPERADLETALADVRKAGRTSDGVVCFNHLYRVITADISKKITQGVFFRDNDFLTQFDVIFADRYLDAIRRYSDPEKYGLPPACWRILFENRKDQEISPMQFAICGVTCHVWLDLPIAVVQVCKEMGKSLDEHTHSDFQKVNDIFHEKIPKLRRHFEDQYEREFDRSFIKRLANHVCDFILVQSRDLAWQHATELWDVRETPGNNGLTTKENDLDSRAAEIVQGILWTPLVTSDLRAALAVLLALLRTGLLTLVRLVTGADAVRRPGWLAARPRPRL